MVKRITLWKLNFFKNDDGNGGAMIEAIKECPINNIIIHSQTQKNGRLWGYIEPTKFLKLLEKNYGLYEVMNKFPHKVYFDIDKKGMFNDLDMFKNIILQYFPNAEMAISGSIKETKTSFHIILQNYIINNESDRKYMKYVVKYLCENVEESFDWKVYTKNRNMKCINQSKDDGRIQEIIENSDFKAHCVSCFVSPHSLPFPELPIKIQEEVMISKSKRTFNLGILPKIILSVPEDFDVTNATAEKILSMLPIDKSFNHDYTHLVARFCFYNNLSLDYFLSWISKKHNPLTNEVIEKWKYHFSRLDKFPSVSKDKMIVILNQFYPHIKKDIHYRNFAQSFELPNDNIKKIETIHQDCFFDNEKYSIFNVGMGGGKTAQTISYLKLQPNFVWIAPNRALGTNTNARFENENIDVCHYERISTKDKKEGKLKEKEKLIICLNSIHYIKNTKYEIVVIDEIETILDKFLGDFLEQGTAQLKSQIWNIFLSLFINAKKVLLLDAFITSKTINFIKLLEASPSFTIYERLNEPQTRVIKYMEDDKTMITDIIEKIKNGQKLFIFYPYKKLMERYMSMEQLNNLIELATGKKGIFYNADVGDKQKSGLNDVNTSWLDKSFIITNNIITCGVNYENKDFDYTYIFIASHNTPRDIIQVSYRTRNLNSGIIKICYLGKMTPSNTWLNDCEKINCPIYSSLFNDILVEKKAPLKRAFQLFCFKAHYNQKTDNYKVNEIIAEELKKIEMNHQLGNEYENIYDIELSQAEIIESKCFAQQATMNEKYALNKYYFKKAFVDNSNPEILRDIWNENYNFFFKRIASVLKDNNNLFNDIAKENKLKTLFPVDIKKTKLSKELKDKIFNQFSFKFITNASNDNKILKEIYNTYFSKHIIRSFYTENKNVCYEIDDKVFDFYEFAKSNLILDNLTYMTYNNINAGEEDIIEI